MRHAFGEGTRDARLRMPPGAGHGSLDPEKLGLPRGKRRKEQKARKNIRKREPDVKCKALLRFCVLQDALMRNLSSDVFEGRTSTASEPFSLLIYLDATKCVFLKCHYS